MRKLQGIEDTDGVGGFTEGGRARGTGLVAGALGNDGTSGVDQVIAEALASELGAGISETAVGTVSLYLAVVRVTSLEPHGSWCPSPASQSDYQ